MSVPCVPSLRTCSSVSKSMLIAHDTQKTRRRNLLMKPIKSLIHSSLRAVGGTLVPVEDNVHLDDFHHLQHALAAYNDGQLYLFLLTNAFGIPFRVASTRSSPMNFATACLMSLQHSRSHVKTAPTVSKLHSLRHILRDKLWMHLLSCGLVTKRHKLQCKISASSRGLKRNPSMIIRASGNPAKRCHGSNRRRW